MANIVFKRGLKADLPATITDGSVYITTDEKAMYVDVSSTNRIRIGQLLLAATIQELATLPKDEQALYYVEETKGLYKALSTGTFRQINITATFAALISNYQSAAADLSTLPQDLTNGSGAVLTETITGTDNVNKQLTIDYYTTDAELLVVEGNTVNIANGTSTKGTITFRTANLITAASISAASGGGNTATISITNTTTGTGADGSTVNRTESQTSSVSLAGGTGITLSTSNGVITIAGGGGVQQLMDSFDATGKYVFQVKDLNNNVISSAGLTPTITYGGSGGSSATFQSGTAVLNVYTKSEVDAAISEAGRSMNAMTFRGSVGANLWDTLQALPTTNVSIGDTYKITTAGTYEGQRCNVGDMMIATLDDNTIPEDANGYITSGNIAWIYIPSGDDDVRTYTLEYDNTYHGIVLKDSKNNFLGNVTSANSSITIGQGTTARDIIITHATITVTNTTGTAITQQSQGSASIQAVTGVTVDSTGHITGIEKTTFTAVDTQNSIATVTTSSSAAQDNNSATVTHTITDAHNLARSGSHTFSSETLKFTANNNGTQINLTWGSF